MTCSLASSSAKFARCPSAGSLQVALKKAVAISFAEFRIPGDVPVVFGDDCASLEGSWGAACVLMRSRISHRAVRIQSKLRLTLSSCKRLFDAACPPCDIKAAGKARVAWDAHVGRDVDPAALDRCRAFLPHLRARVRVLVDGWGRRLKESRNVGGVPYLGEYVPDIKGCFEVPSREGGTLACSEGEYSGDWGLLRRGVAKGKGKHRVVTMQSAEVKRVLTPVHCALYDHISSFGWCVRGDVKKGDFECVRNDRREGEDFISGDYRSATDFIYLPAVEAIVEVLSECPELTEWERSILVESFSDLRWQSRSGGEHPIKRGSMMGNLVSFPLLCLLNKASFEIACDLDAGRINDRCVRINGDDCLFNGTSRFFGIWRSVTAVFGLVVNEEKTGVSGRWMELNSSIYDACSGRFVPKPVLSFLRPKRNVPGPLLPGVIRGTESFRFSVRLWIVCELMRYEITLRGIRGGLHCLTREWRRELLPRRWFREGCLSDPSPTKECGVNRELPSVVVSPPDSFFYPIIDSLSAKASRSRTEEWTGVRVVPYTKKLDRRRVKEWSRRRNLTGVWARYYWGGLKWVFCLPAQVFDFLTDVVPEALRPPSTRKWIDDHPFISTAPRILVSPPPPRRYPPPAYDTPSLPDYPLGHR